MIIFNLYTHTHLLLELVGCRTGDNNYSRIVVELRSIRGGSAEWKLNGGGTYGSDSSMNIFSGNENRNWREDWVKLEKLPNQQQLGCLLGLMKSSWPFSSETVCRK